MNPLLRFTILIIAVATLLTGCTTTQQNSTKPQSFASAADSADDFLPTYDVVGHWTDDGGLTQAEYTREGSRVTFTYNNSGYEHTFAGKYVNGTTIKGIQTRRSRSDNTVTRMALTLKFTSPNTIRIDWVALDANSDLAKGQKGVVDIQRVPSEIKSGVGNTD